MGSRCSRDDGMGQIISSLKLNSYPSFKRFGLLHLPVFKIRATYFNRWISYTNPCPVPSSLPSWPVPPVPPSTIPAQLVVITADLRLPSPPRHLRPGPRTLPPHVRRPATPALAPRHRHRMRAAAGPCRHPRAAARPCCHPSLFTMRLPAMPPPSPSPAQCTLVALLASSPGKVSMSLLNI